MEQRVADLCRDTGMEAMIVSAKVEAEIALLDSAEERQAFLQDLGIEEPALFSEPGLFMVTPEQTLYYGSVQTMPFVRPHFSELVGALDFAIKNNYPARGEYTGTV